MGIFRKEERIYSFKEVIKKLKDDNYKRYRVEIVEGGYRLIRDRDGKEYELIRDKKGNAYRVKGRGEVKNPRESFIKDLRVDVYPEYGGNKGYNNYSGAKKYDPQQWSR